MMAPDLRRRRRDSRVAQVIVDTNQNVKAMKLPTLLDGLVMTVAVAEAASEISGATGLLPDDETVFYVLDTSACSGYVVAGVVAEAEDDGEYFEPSELWPGPEGSLR